MSASGPRSDTAHAGTLTMRPARLGPAVPAGGPAATRQRIGLVSDTHGLLRPEAEDFLRGADLIVHGGDIGSEAILERLRRLAPLVVVRGNNDREPWAASIAEREHVAIGGIGLLVIHDRAALRGDALPADVDLVISGHSHKPSLDRVGTRLHVNPGSAGPRRFSLPVSVAELLIERGTVTARLVELDVPAARR